jgi:putative acetyltransferase
MKVRPVLAADHGPIDAVMRAAFLAAFGRADELELVAGLRAQGDVVLELVCTEDRVIVGHILFSRAHVVADGKRHPVVQLAPVCADPDLQKRGIGSALIRQGLALMAALDETHVFVLGHPDYYPRFDFSAKAAQAYEAPWTGPRFMLNRIGAGGPARGKLRVSSAFG